MTTQTCEEAVRAVLGDPDSDAARFACAEAFEAAGYRDRAEFIRLQMEAAVRARTTLDEWKRDFPRERGLLKDHLAEWAGELRSDVGPNDFFRGFVERITTDGETFLVRGEHLFARAPIRRLILRGVGPVPGALFHSPYAERLVYLSFDTQTIDDRGLEVIAASPHLQKLAWLDLRGCSVTLKGVEALAASSNLPSLRYLGLYGTGASAVAENVWDDQGATIGAQASVEGRRLEDRYGHKAWLHTIEDNAGNELSEHAL